MRKPPLTLGELHDQIPWVVLGIHLIRDPADLLVVSRRVDVGVVDADCAITYISTMTKKSIQDFATNIGFFSQYLNVTVVSVGSVGTCLTNGLEVIWKAGLLVPVPDILGFNEERD